MQKCVIGVFVCRDAAMLDRIELILAQKGVEAIIYYFSEVLNVCILVQIDC